MNYVIQHGSYPHWCRIYKHKTTGADLQFRDESDEQFAGLDEGRCECGQTQDDDIVVMYEGECIKYGSSQMRKFANGSVIKADHCVDIPFEVPGIHSGDRIDVVDKMGEWHDIEIVVAFVDDVYGMGTTVFFNVTFN